MGAHLLTQYTSCHAGHQSSTIQHRTHGPLPRHSQTPYHLQPMQVLRYNVAHLLGVLLRHGSAYLARAPEVLTYLYTPLLSWLRIVSASYKNETTETFVQGNVCVVNGSPHLCSVLLYERTRKQWLRHAPMNHPRLHAAMASVGGRLYIMVSSHCNPSPAHCNHRIFCRQACSAIELIW